MCIFDFFQFSDLIDCILPHTGEEVIELISNNFVIYGLIPLRGGLSSYAQADRLRETVGVIFIT